MHTFRLLALGSFLWASAALGQVYTAGSVVFLNPGPYTHQQLEAAAAIHAGTRFTAEELTASAQRLVDTGYFDDVTASLMGKFSAMTVTYTLKPTPKSDMLHVAFENLIWLTPEQIDAAIRSRSPLFQGYLPEGSPNQDILKEALADTLAAKGVSATVGYETVEPGLSHPVREIDFRVTNPVVRVTQVKLGGVTQDLVPYVQKSVNGTARKPFVAAPVGIATADQILQPLYDAGYLKASLSDVQVTSAPEPDGTVGVTLAATLDAGQIYRVAAINYPGMPLLSTEEFAAKAKLHAGDVASRKALLETLAPVDQAYRRQGYMDVTVVADPAWLPETHQVSYAVTVTPGEPYKVNDLSTVNLDPAGKAAFDAAFRMKTGEVFNPEYVAQFQRDNNSVQALEHLTATYTAYAHPRTHTVDLVVMFQKR